jgi:hypothetical protein
MEKFVWTFEETSDRFLKVVVIDTTTKKKYCDILTGINFVLTYEQIKIRSRPDGTIENNISFILTKEQLKKSKKHFEELEIKWTEEDAKKTYEMLTTNTKQYFYNFVKKQINENNYSIIMMDECLICIINEDVNKHVLCADMPVDKDGRIIFHTDGKMIFHADVGPVYVDVSNMIKAYIILKNIPE